MEKVQFSGRHNFLDICLKTKKELKVVPALEKCTYAEGISKKMRQIISKVGPWREGLGVECCFGTHYEKL